MNLDFQQITALLPFLIPLAVIQLLLLVIALIDVVKREKVTGGNKVVWILVIVFINIVGPIIYLLVGRKESEIDRDTDS